MPLTHVRYDDDEARHFGHRYVCGIDVLPTGDKWFGCYEPAADLRADCPRCNPNPRQLGTPLSQLSGRPGEPGFAEFSRIARSWGFD